MPSSAKTSILRAALVASTQQSTTVTMFSPSKSFPHYIFGYGSLICPDSRAVTAPSLQGRYATPVIIKHWERTWSCPYEPCKMTFLGIQAAPNRNCVGVLVPVNEDELLAFDDREAGYDRVSIPLKDIRPYQQDAGKRTMNDKEQYTYFQQVEDQQDTGEDRNSRCLLPQVWVYVPQNHLPTNVECPLAQTYIDIILRGCLTISVDFCQHVLHTTRGWDARDHDGNDQGDNDYDETTKTMTGKRKNATVPTAESTIANPGHSNNPHQSALSSSDSVFWVNDRQDPLYIRADADYSRRHADLIDGLIRRHRPEIRYRITYERVTLLDEHKK